MHNVGSIFRSADAFGVEKIWLSGYTASPPRKEIAKTALGSENRVPWERAEDISILLADLRKNGYLLLGLDNAPGAVPLETVRSEKPVALVLGSEVEGIAAPVREALDALVEIPLAGSKRSLNVSVATGIALFVLAAKK